MINNYFGSDLNKFIHEDCTREMTCINIDCALLKFSKKRMMLIESKHDGEHFPKQQRNLLEILAGIFSRFKLDIEREFGFQVGVYVVRGNQPYHNSTVTDLATNMDYVLPTQKDLIQWLEFNKEL